MVFVSAIINLSAFFDVIDKLIGVEGFHIIYICYTHLGDETLRALVTLCFAWIIIG